MPILNNEPIFNTVDENNQVNHTIVMHQKCLNFNEVVYKPQVNPKPVLTRDEEVELNQQYQQFHQKPELQQTTGKVNQEENDHYQAQLKQYNDQQQGYQHHLQHCPQYNNQHRMQNCSQQLIQNESSVPNPKKGFCCLQ